MYAFNRDESNKIVQHIYDTKLGNKIINGIIDYLNKEEKNKIEERARIEYIRNNPLEPIDDNLPKIKEDEYEETKKKIEEYSIKIRKQYKCKMCGSTHNGNGKCNACGRDNIELQSDIKELNSLLFRLPDDFFEKDKINNTLTKLYHLEPMKINKVNEIINKTHYDLTVILEFAELKDKYDDILSNKIELSKEEYDFIIDTLLNDEISKEYLNIKYLLLDFCMKAAIEKNKSFEVTEEEFEDIFRKMAEKISKEEAGAFKINVKFVDKEKMENCHGDYTNLFSEVRINRNTLMSNPIEGLSVIYHEIVHQWQDVELRKKQTINNSTFIQIMDIVNRKVLGEKYYNDNYLWLFSELQAHLSQDVKAFEYLKRINVEVPQDYMDYSKQTENYYNAFINNNTYLYRKDDNNWYFVQDLFEKNIYNHSEFLDSYPQLKMFYKKDNEHIVRKSSSELEVDYNNYKSGLITWNGNSNEINQMYYSTIESFKKLENQSINNQADDLIKKMEQGIDVEGKIETDNRVTNNKQKGYTMIGILGLITCIATIGIIIFGYILFYR